MSTTYHRFVSGVADGADATVARPSNWNDAHDTTRINTADVLVSAGCSHIVVGDYEIAAGVALEIGAGAVMEIS